VKSNEGAMGADLGSSSSYSNGEPVPSLQQAKGGGARGALKVVVDKGSLRVALMQRLVGPKRLEKSYQPTRKGTRFIFRDSLAGGLWFYHEGCKAKSGPERCE